MKSSILNRILLILILGFYGWRLAGYAWGYHKRPAEEKANNLIANRKLIFNSAAGIDIRGASIDTGSNNGKSARTVVFLLHNASLQKDLEFWHKVDSAMGRVSRVRLIAYCDGQACANSLRQTAWTLDFPVVEYGEVVSSEALVNADIDGDAILRVGTEPGRKRISWRTPSTTPSQIISEALK